MGNSPSTDGTKLKANASRRRVLRREEIEFLLRFVDEELEQWARQDEIEDREYGELRGMWINFQRAAKRLYRRRRSTM